MFDYSGSLDGAQLDWTLWSCVALPWLAALLALRAALASDAQERERLSRLARQASWVCAALVVGVLVLAAVRLGTAAPEVRRALAPGWTVLSIGTLDVNTALVLTAFSLPLALAAAVAGALFIVRAQRASLRRLGGGSAALGSVMLGVLADDVVIAVMGAALAHCLLLVCLAPEPGARSALSFGLGRLGELCLIAAMALGAWAVGGNWVAGGGYVPGFLPRVVGVEHALESATPVTAGSVPSDPNGRLTFTALPGATLRVGSAVLCAVDADGRDGGVGVVSRPCRRVATSPFTELPAPAALHEVVIVTGPGTYDLAVEKVRIRPGVTTDLVLLGPTTSLTRLADQARLRDASGAFPAKSALSAARVLGVPAPTGIAVLLLIGLLSSMTALLARRESAPDDPVDDDLALALGGVLVAAKIVAGLGFVVALSGLGTVLAILVSVLVAAWLALRAAYARNTARALGLLASASAATGAACVFAGAPVHGVVHVAVVCLGLVGLGAASGWPSLEKAAGSASGSPGLWLSAQVAAGAPLPLIGAGVTLDGGVRALSSLDAGSVPPWLLGLLLCVGASFTSFACWRIAFVAARGKRVETPKGAAGLLPLAPPVLGAVLALLAASGPLLAPLEAMLRAWWVPAAEIAPPSQPLLGDVALGFVVLGFAAAVIGFVFARRRYARDDWATAESSRVFGGRLSGETPELTPIVSKFLFAEVSVVAAPLTAKEPAEPSVEPARSKRKGKRR